MSDNKKHNVTQAAIGTGVVEGGKALVSTSIGALAGIKIGEILQDSEAAKGQIEKIKASDGLGKIRDGVSDLLKDNKLVDTAKSGWSKMDAILPNVITNKPVGEAVKFAAVAAVTIGALGAVAGAVEASKANNEIDASERENAALKSIVTNAVSNGRVAEAELQLNK